MIKYLQDQRLNQIFSKNIILMKNDSSLGLIVAKE